MKKTLLLFLLLPFLGFAQVTVGTHIVGPSQPAPYNSLALAITNLNTGIDKAGAVILLLDESETLNSQLIINKFSDNNSLTIKPNINKSITISGNFGNSSSASLIKLNGARNVTIDGSNSTLTSSNLTFKNVSTINYDNSAEVHSAIVWIANTSGNGANNNIIKNVSFEGSSNDPTSATSAGIVLSNTTNMQTAETISNSDNTISNNFFSKMKFGIWVLGGSALNQNLVIANNTFGSSTGSDAILIDAIKLSNTQNTTVSGNKVLRLARTNNSTFIAGIYLYNKSLNCSIVKNKISNIKSTGLAAGIYIDIDATNDANLNISNNFIYGIQSSANNQYDYTNAGHGIYFSAGKKINVFFNSVVLNENQGTLSAPMFIKSGNNFDIRNNIFYNSQTGNGIKYALYSLINDKTIFSTINYNIYLTSSGGFVGFMGANQTSIADWRIKTSQDLQSTSNIPVFSTELYLDASSTTNKSNLGGTSITSITTDIDNNARVKPYIGAHELVACVPAGDQTSFGNNTWTGYVYRMANNAALPPNVAYPALPASTIATYIGTVTENKEFDRNVGTGAITGTTTNFACDAAPSDRFFVRYKMRTTITEAGLYSFDLGSDDGIRLLVDGVQVFTRWNQHGYTADYFTQNLSVGDHEFVLEYYEDGGEARVAFTSRLPKGDPTVFGDKVWNVYGYVNNDLTLANTRYAGYYVDPNLNIESTTYWPRAKSPSVAVNWQGALIPDNNFTTVFKRKGFPCGQYQIQRANYDDAIEIYIDGNLVFSRSGWDNNPALINNGALYKLNSNSRVEIRLREDGGDANLGINFIKKDLVYNGTGTLESGSSVVINANTTLTSDLTVCSCTINPNYTLTVPKNITLTVDEDINVGTGGKLLIQSGGALLQTTTSKTMFTGNTTAFELQRTNNISRYDLTYWSTPVTNSTFTMHDLSPETLYDKYFHWDAAGSRWLVDPNGTSVVMQVGKGYSIRGPQSYEISTAKDFTAKFNGTPNNGTIAVTVEKDKYNLIGNPYPSAVDARLLLDVSRNPDIGALYFWTHNSPPTIIPGTNTYRYSSSDYVVYTLTGSTRIDNSPIAKGFDGKIAAGQGFFVKPKSAVINFTNDTRKGAADNNQFYKTAKTTDLEANHLWLNLTNAEGAFKQLLVGYIEGATNGIDQNYDGISMSSNTYIDFYSFNESKKLTVQGRALPFENTDIVQLGYKSTIEGEFTIAIDHADGIFDTQEVYLEDKFTGIITDLRKENYTFKTAIGTSTTRFVLRYTNKTLGTDDFENSTNNVLVSVKSKVIKVNTGTENIKEVNIYNIGGQLIYNKNKVDSNELTISNLPSGNQVLLIKVTLDNDREVTKKIIFN